MYVTEECKFHLCCVHSEDCSARRKWPVCGADHSPPSIVEVLRMTGVIPPLPYITLWYAQGQVSESE